MNSPTHTSTVRFTAEEIKQAGGKAAVDLYLQQAFEAGFDLGRYMHKKSMAAVNTYLAQNSPTPDSPAPQQDAPAIPMPTPTMMLAATPAPVVAEEAPSDEDPFAEFRSNQNQTTAHHA